MKRAFWPKATSSTYCLLPLVSKRMESVMMNGVVVLLGSTVTSAKINILSLAAISTLVIERVDLPLIFNLKCDALPLAKAMDEIFIFWLWLLYTINWRVLEPTVVKTVSNKTVSPEKANLAELSVNKTSFLQEKRVVINKSAGSRILILFIL